MNRKLDPKIREEAERWFTRRLDPVVRREESQDFQRWLGQSLEREIAYAEVRELWESLEQLKDVPSLKRLAAQEANVRASWLVRVLGALFPERAPMLVPALLGVVGVALFLNFWMGKEPPLQQFTTALGEQRTETLSDGSTLRLNTDSQVDFRINGSRREIFLRRGEAAFDVAKDPRRPFVVTSGGGEVTALGTHFLVRNEQGMVFVTLTEGRVQISRPEYHEIEWLDPGQQASFKEVSGGIVRRNVDVALVMGWMSGRLELRDVPLSEAVGEANRYSARKIRIGDPEIGSIAVSGSFRTGDVDSLANALSAAFPVRARFSDKEVVLLADQKRSRK
ncbi:FecR family protein [Pseudoxanthomonas putridarboris]|uniref:FecR family protein n=1 Tax=Pseudoxanthomonas putridarboris TaxID=752605 RepID=A0ABU9IX14_9GAMM